MSTFSLSTAAGRAAVAVAICLATPALARDGQGAARQGEAPEQLRASSAIAGLAFAMLDKLPRAPASAKRVPEACTRYVVQPKTSGGRTARAFGWPVTGEAAFGPFTAVSFARAFEPATSGTCVVQEGNVGIFTGQGELVALAYAPRGSKTSIGRVSALEGGAIRVWDGDPPGMPVGDIERIDGGYHLRLGALAPQETLCGGRSAVPNIYGKPIDEARKLLWARGWAPIPTQPPPEKDSREGELARRGVTEVEGCSGTGFGYCSFNYRGGGGRLAVTTMGEAEFPGVVGYGVTCP